MSCDGVGAYGTIIPRRRTVGHGDCGEALGTGVAMEWRQMRRDISAEKPQDTVRNRTEGQGLVRDAYGSLPLSWLECHLSLTSLFRR